MAATLEMGVEKSSHDFEGAIRIDQLSAQTKNIRVVVPPGHGRHFFVKDQGGARTGDLVGGYAHADTGAADEQSVPTFARRYGLCDRLSKLGIIRRLRR